MATSKDNKPSKERKERYITQKAFNEHFGLDSHAAKNLVTDKLVRSNEKNQIAESELDRDPNEIASLAAGARRHSLTSAGSYLGVSAAVAKRLIANANISPVDEYRGQYHNWISLYAQRDLDAISQSDEYKKSLERAKKRAEGAKRTENKLEELKDKISSRVKVSFRTRNRPLAKTVLYLGPTNSGKTYQALEELKEAYRSNPEGVFVYAGPLRLLAYEVYEKMIKEFDRDAVGFVTGEDRINEDAPIRCCTVECAPMSGNFLVLDETHWLTDHDRGMHWTNLLVGGEYDEIHAISAKETQGIVSNLLSDASETDVRSFERLLPVEYAGKMPIAQTPSKTAVVAFSKKAVLAIAREIEKRSKRKVGVLYGAMPLANRKRILDEYASGDYDVIVCTDVIGHGINLPIDNIIIAETQKFDGERRRSLKRWEAAQIVGRAGRYGISDKPGKAFALTGLPWLSPNVDIIKNATKVANGTMSADLNAAHALITPSFDDLAVEHPVEMMYALDRWETLAREACKGTSLSPSPMPARKALIEAIASHSDASCYPKATAADKKWKMSADQLWKLSGAPLDPLSNVLGDIVEWANSNDRDSSEALIFAIRELYERSAPTYGEEHLSKKCNERRAAFEAWAHSMDDEDTTELEAEMDRLHKIAQANETAYNQRKKAKKRNRKERAAAKREGREPALEPLPCLYAEDGTELPNGGTDVYRMKDWESSFQDLPLGQSNIKKARKEMERDIDSMLEGARNHAQYILDSQELTYKELTQIETIYNIFGTIGAVDIADVKSSVKNTCENVKSVIGNAIAYNDYGICESCGDQCAPWFRECDECHSSHYRGYYDDYYYW